MRADSAHPGRYPVGSPVSRAAARSLLNARLSQAVLIDFVGVVDGLAVPWFSKWEQSDNGSLSRRSRIPAGMAFDEAQRAAGVAPVQSAGKSSVSRSPGRIGFTMSRSPRSSGE